MAWTYLILNILDCIKTFLGAVFVIFNCIFSIIAINNNIKAHLWQKLILIIKKSGMKF